MQITHTKKLNSGSCVFTKPIDDSLKEQSTKIRSKSS